MLHEDPFCGQVEPGAKQNSHLECALEVEWVSVGQGEAGKAGSEKCADLGGGEGGVVISGNEYDCVSTG